MARGGGFLGGLVVGLVAVGVVGAALWGLPAPGPDTRALRDDLLAGVEAPRRVVERALPAAARTEDCAFSEAVVEALAGTVRGPTGPADATFPTPEAQLDAVLDATRCTRPGAPETLDLVALDEVGRLVPEVAARALGEGDRAVARAWGQRLWALGQDLQAVDPARAGGVGARLVAAGADVVADSLVGAEPRHAAEAGVLGRTLTERAAPGPWVVGHRAAEALRSGLTDPATLELAPGELTGATEAASGWWTALAQASAIAGPELPPRPEAPGVAPLLEPGGEGLVREHRQARAARLGALLVATSRTAEDGCGAPWADEAPVDPVSGRTATWEPTACRLSLGARTWELDRHAPTGR